MIAKSLDKVYANFDPFLPLPSGSEFYVDRKNNPLSEMRVELLRSSEDNDRFPKFLFSGHRGSGKSTELNRLMAYKGIRRSIS